jgi:hypothetical protein
MSSDHIPGTSVPDTPIHRASLWLERVKFAERAFAATEAERMDDTDLDIFVRETGALFTPEQLHEAATYYGRSLARQMLGSRVSFQVPSPTGEGFIGPASLFATIWMDAFEHGVATALGKTATTPDEERQHSS